MRVFVAFLAGIWTCVGLMRADGDGMSPLVMEVKSPQVIAVGNVAELKKQPELTASGVTVKLGLESVKVPAGSGVLAYCLWTPEPGRSYVSTGPRPVGQLGPLSVQVKKEGAAVEAAQVKTSTTFGLAGEQVSVAALTVQEAGKYTAEFYAQDGTMVARADLEAVENKMPPWYGLTLAAADHLTEQPPTLLANVKLGLYAVNPCWRTAASAKVNEGLRAFVPDAADPDFKAGWVDGSLELTTKGPLLLGSSNSNFMVRWWLNGKAVTVNEKGPRVMPTSNPKTSKLEGDVKVHLSIDGVVEAIGAKAGDKVEAQVLYTTFGWDYAMSVALARMTRAGQEAAGPVLRLSNKAKMVVGTK